jgi:hypothetical protein
VIVCVGRLSIFPPLAEPISGPRGPPRCRAPARIGDAENGPKGPQPPD